jgi:N utilization substance protein B
MSGSRRLGRQHAFVILCSLDLGQDNVERAIESFWSSTRLTEDLDSDEKPLVQRQVKDSERDFADRLVRGVHQNLSEIDMKLSAAAHNWTLQRMALVDRNLLRLGVFEIVFEEQTAHRVSINEAVELAKRFGEHTSIKGKKGRYSPQFVNGVLDKIASQTPGKETNRDVRRRRKGGLSN